MTLLSLMGALASQPHYGRVQFRLVPTETSVQDLLASVEAAALHRATTIRIGPLGEPGTLDSLDDDLQRDVLRVLKVVLESKEPFAGVELDLFLGSQGHRVPATVRWEGDVLSVEWGPVYQPTWERTSRGIVAGRYGLEAVQDGTRSWNRPLLGMVERAFERLSEPERLVLRGMRLQADHRYEPNEGEPAVPFTPGAVYRADDHTIQVFDASFGPSFVGSVDAPEPVGVFMLLHEIAHAIDATADGEPPSERFAREVAGVGVTNYGATSSREAFAEAFALWRTDRAALVRISKEAAGFFDEAKHLSPAVSGPSDTGP